jgi:hypothetical protein
MSTMTAWSYETSSHSMRGSVSRNGGAIVSSPLWQVVRGRDDRSIERYRLISSSCGSSIGASR